MTNNMTSLDLFEQFDGLNDLFVAEAEIPEAHKSVAILPAPRQKRRFAQFINSSWGVAIICALVAVSVMGGIIWAGNRPVSPPPAGSALTEDLTFEQEVLEDIDPPAAEVAAKAPRFGWEKSVKSVETTAFYSPVTYNMLEIGEYHVTEISLATREDSTRTLMFRLINRETFEVMARYTWDVTEGKWGVMEMGGGFAVYHTTEKGEMTTIWFDFFIWMPELDPATYECVGTFHPTILSEESGSYLWKHPRVEDTRAWSQFVREFFTDYPTAYLCMDEALGDLTFYTEDNRYTDGWERMRLFWQDLYILNDGETTGGLEIVTEVRPEVVVTDEVGSEDIMTDFSAESESETVKPPLNNENAIRCSICGEYGCDCIIPPETLPPQDETFNNLEVPTEPETEATTEMLLPPTKPASGDLEFYITQNVEDVDFSSHAEIYGWFGAREFLGKGYETVLDEDGNPTHPEHCVSYVISAYPDEADGGQYVTQITITDPQVAYYGLTVHSTAEVFRETFERLGYTVKISLNSNEETFSAEKGNLRIRLNKWKNEQPILHVIAEVTNREGIIY